MKATTININAIRSLIPYAYGAVVHFCRSSARCYGKIALREQLSYEAETGNYSTYEMVEEDRGELQREIINLANAIGNSAQRLNSIAEKKGLVQPLPGVDSMNVSDLIHAVMTYVESLVDAADNEIWLEELEERC